MFAGARQVGIYSRDWPWRAADLSNGRHGMVPTALEILVVGRKAKYGICFTRNTCQLLRVEKFIVYLKQRSKPTVALFWNALYTGGGFSVNIVFSCGPIACLCAPACPARLSMSFCLSVFFIRHARQLALPELLLGVKPYPSTWHYTAADRHQILGWA